MEPYHPDCLFCRLARREMPAHIVYEDEFVTAFLDIGPIRPGHTQVVPKSHHETFDDLPLSIAAHVLDMGQKLAKAMKRSYGVTRVAFLFTGGDVSHAHAHLVPMREKTDITSTRYIANENLTFRAAPRAAPEELELELMRLRAALAPHL
jgi:histidine triad (HIT) family protein